MTRHPFTVEAKCFLTALQARMEHWLHHEDWEPWKEGPHADLGNKAPVLVRSESARIKAGSPSGAAAEMLYRFLAPQRKQLKDHGVPTDLLDRPSLTRSLERLTDSTWGWTWFEVFIEIDCREALANKDFGTQEARDTMTTPMSFRYISATAAAKASACQHTWWLECHGDPSKKQAPDAGTLLMFERGKHHEKERIATLPEYATPEWDGKDWAKGHAATVDLMRSGKPWIYQGVLMVGDLRGFPDLLQRIPASSALGDYSYIPVDVKDHKEVTRKDKFQLAAYAEMLGPILGVSPEHGAIWLNTGAMEAVDLRKVLPEYGRLLAEMRRISNGDLATHGFRCGECDRCPWADHCWSEWERDGQVSLLAGVSGRTAERIFDAGFRSWRDITPLEEGAVAAALGIKDPEAARDVWLHAKARESGRPQARKPADFPKDVPVHYYDIETYGDCVYLHGDIRIFGSEREEKQFVARDPSQERDAWRGFLDYLARDAEALVYCWADYERSHVHALWAKYGGNPAGWRHLEGNLVDQKEFVKEHFALPVSTYGIKEVAPAFGFRWTAEDAGGLNSEAWYGEWLKGQDEALLAKILQYNLDDVRAMEVVLLGLKKEAGL